jgi:hypothetical protein
VIRQARLNGALGANGLTIRQAAAQLPGGSDVSVFGHVALGDAPRFDGQLEGGADNLRSLFDWLQIDAQAIPPDRLRRVSVTTGLSVTGDGVELANIDLQFDASRLTGSLVATLGARPAFGANLRLNRINLEAYLPRSARAPPAQPATASPTVPPLAWLTRFDANLQLRIDQMSYNTVPLQGVVVDATLERATLSLHELSSESVAGVRVIVGGVLRRARWPAEAELTVSAQGSDPSRLLELLGWDGATPALGPLAVSLAATGPLDRLHLVLESEIAGGVVRALGDVDLAAPDAIVLSGGSLTVRHGETLRLLRALVPGYRPAAEGLGPFELAGTVRATGGKLELDDAAFKLGPSAFTGRAALDLTKPRPELGLKLAGAVLVLDPLLARRAEEPTLGAALWAGVAALPATLATWPALDVVTVIELGELDYGRHGASAVALDLAIQDRALRLTRLSAAAWDGTVVLTGAFDINRDGAAALRVGLTDVAAARAADALLGTAGIDGRLDLELDVSTGGLTERDLRGALVGKGRMVLRDGALPGFDLAALAARLKDAAGDAAAGVVQDLSHGRTAITRGSASVSVQGGRLATEDGNAGGPGGAIDLRGGVDLAARQVDLRLQLRPAGDGATPPARLRIAGPLDAPTHEVDAQALIAFLSARPPAPAAGQPGSDVRRSGGGR